MNMPWYTASLAALAVVASVASANAQTIQSSQGQVSAPGEPYAGRWYADAAVKGSLSTGIGSSQAGLGGSASVSLFRSLRPSENAFGFIDSSNCVGTTVTYGQLWSDWAAWRPARSERWLMAGLRVDAHDGGEEVYLLMEALGGVMHIDDPASANGESHAALGFGMSVPMAFRSFGERQVSTLSVLDLTYIVTPTSNTSKHRLFVSSRLSLEFGFGE